MPAALHVAASSSLILREASLMSVSPLQNVLNPSPVPGPLIVYLKSGFVSASASATPVEIGSTVAGPETLVGPRGEIGSTVDEPDTLMVPVTAPAALPEAAVLAPAGAPLCAAPPGAAPVAVAGAAAPLLEQAPTTNNAARANAERRFGLVMVTR